MLLERVSMVSQGRPACAPHQIMAELSGTKHYRATDCCHHSGQRSSSSLVRSTHQTSGFCRSQYVQKKTEADIAPLYLLITPFVDQIPLRRTKRPSHMAHMDQIELFTPCPFLQHVVNLQNTVWRYPGSRRWEKVDASNGGYSVLAVRLRNEEECLPLGNMSATSLRLVREIILA